jgi:AraC family L-rhamnose operon regulatory protein RhaS
MYIEENLNFPQNQLKTIPGYFALFILEPQYRRQHNFKSHLRLTRNKLLKVESLVGKIEQEELGKNPGYEVLLYSYLVFAE